MNALSAPFPWMGGKRLVADEVWRRFGNVPNYVEPFYGSGAVLLGRPQTGKIETVNDLDGGICNFWRAIAAAPDEVAKWCDWPVCENDLHARHLWLVETLEGLRERLSSDPHFYDAKVAGWWTWGICQWIGGQWCDPKAVKWKRRPHLAGGGHGIHQLTRKIPNITSSGAGVHRRLPAIGNNRGIFGVAAAPCEEWFRALQERLRRVRIVCGDWNRVLGNSTLGGGKNVGGRSPCGIFLDPPYSHEVRAKNIYTHESGTVSGDVRAWAIEHGDNPQLRIALCGYEGEHEMPSNWRVYEWTAGRGYSIASNENRKRERIWFSPHCLRSSQAEMFDCEVAS